MYELDKDKRRKVVTSTNLAFFNERIAGEPFASSRSRFNKAESPKISCAGGGYSEADAAGEITTT